MVCFSGSGRGRVRTGCLCTPLQSLASPTVWWNQQQSGSNKNHHQLMREVNLPLPNLITSSCKAKAVLLRVPKSPLMVQKVPERYWSKIFFPPICQLMRPANLTEEGEVCRWIVHALPVRSAGARRLSPVLPAADTTWTAGADAEEFVYAVAPSRAAPGLNTGEPLGLTPPEPLSAPRHPCCTIALSSSKSVQHQIQTRTGGHTNAERRALLPACCLH